MTWQDDLTYNGIMMKESAVTSALSNGINEKAELAGTTVSIQESNFCASLDSAICELAPSFVDSNETVFSSNLSELCTAAGYNTVVYGAPANAVILKNGGVRFNSEYVAQRKAILNLFITVKSDEIISAESITLSGDHVFVNKNMSVEYTIIPDDATTQLEWIVDKNQTGTHFSSSELTFDANGVVTLHDAWVQGTPIFQKVVDTISGVSSVWLTYNSDGIKGYYSAPGKNVLAKLIAAYQGTFTQNGITLTHNSDGTITLDGTSSASSTSYMRFVLWPIGNTKTANNITLLTGNSNCKHVVWANPIVDFPKEASSLITNNAPKAYELYFMDESSQIATKIERQDASTTKFAAELDNTRKITGVVFGIQLNQGAKLDNVTFDVGVQEFPTSGFVNYGGELANYLACNDVVIHKTDSTLDFIVRCYNDGKLRTWSRGYAYYITTTYYRITNSILESNNLTDLVTEDTIGTVGNTYQLDFHVESGEWQQHSNETKLGILLIDDTGDIITAAYAIDRPESTVALSISDQTFSTTFTLDRKINAAVLYLHDIRQRVALFKFDITLTDITNA